MNLKISPPILLNADDFRLGYKPIDEQHAEIIHCINELYMKRFTGDTKDLTFVIDRLNDHVSEHFKFEENMMRECSYPHITEHMIEHAKIKVDSKMLVKRFMTGDEISEELQEFLFNMLRHHINNIDRRAVAYYLNYLEEQEDSWKTKMLKKILDR